MTITAPTEKGIAMYDILQMIVVGMTAFILGAYAGAVFASSAESWDVISDLAVTAQKASKNIKKAEKKHIKSELVNILHAIDLASVDQKTEYTCGITHPENVKKLQKKGFTLKQSYDTSYYFISWGGEKNG